MAFRVYTKTGDKGSTALIGGKRVGKDHIRIEAYGTVDELNAHIGVLTSYVQNESSIEELREIQDRLFTICSVLATDPDKNVRMSLPDLHEEDVVFLEKAIDQMEEQLPPLRKFVLPGGTAGNGFAHVARCVCRRAERICVAMVNNDEYVPEIVLTYLNRLSDYLFVISRLILIQAGEKDVEWRARKE